MKDKELIERVLKNDTKAQEVLYQQYTAKMYSLCLRYARHQMEAEDLLQDGFIKVFSHLNEYKFNGSFEGWIRRIFTNNAINAVNKKQFKNEFYLPDANNEILAKDVTIIEKISEQDLIKVISTLPIGYRTIFNMYVIDGYSHAEIAEMLEITESTSRSQLTKAKKMLRDILNNTENNEQHRRIG